MSSSFPVRTAEAFRGPDAGTTFRSAPASWIDPSRR